MKWQIQQRSHPQTVTEVVQVVLENRKITDSAAFLKPPHPAELTLQTLGINQSAINWAIKRLRQAISAKEAVVIFGDYDADGITATAILWRVLHQLGLPVKPFIPDRQKHGYGLSVQAIDDVLADSSPQLVITVDNGIVAHQAVEYLHSKGIDCLVTDHHQAEATLPAAKAVIHTTQLCGATVAWILAREVAKAFGKPELAMEELDLCGIATIADQVPLYAANRSFAYHGLAALRQTKRVGLQTLFQLIELDPKTITETEINYQIGPRLNAAGRIAHGMDALRLLCTKQVKAARTYAAALVETNTQRQSMTSDMVQVALEQARVQQDQQLLVVHSTDFHEGVIGLIAGRICEMFYKPTIALTSSEQMVKASARSVSGVNIIDLIRQVKDDLLDAGGHPMAAGFSLSQANVALVSEKLQRLAKEQITPDLLVATLDMDCFLSGQLTTLELADALQQLAPFGQGNPKPLFVWPAAEIIDLQPIGQDGKHLKLRLQVGENTVTGLAWRKGKWVEDLAVGQRVDVAGSLEVNEWRGRRSVQIIVVDKKQPSSEEEG